MLTDVLPTIAQFVRKSYIPNFRARRGKKSWIFILLRLDLNSYIGGMGALGYHMQNFSFLPSITAKPIINNPRSFRYYILG